MKNSKNPKPVEGTKGFAMFVMPSRTYLGEAIEQGSHCDPRKCWHFLEINAIVHRWDADNKAHIRVDAGHIKLNYGGWRYVTDTPRHVKRSLMLFDKKRYDEIHVRSYTLRFRRTTKIIPLTQARRDQITAARRARIAAGRPDRRYTSMRKRVEGFSAVV